MSPITKEEWNRLITCPDCDGSGYFDTPARQANCNRRVMCAKCRGDGAVPDTVTNPFKESE